MILWGVFMLYVYLNMLETEEERSKFTKLYNKYAKLMKYVAMQKLGDEQLAEDAVHNAFLNIIRSFCTIDEVECHKTKRLLVIVTENAAVDILRSRSRHPLTSFEELEPVLSVEPDLLEGLVLEELTDRIAALPSIYRDVLELKAYHGLNDKQIAVALDVGHATVRKRLQRARTILAQELSCT